MFEKPESSSTSLGTRTGPIGATLWPISVRSDRRSTKNGIQEGMWVFKKGKEEDYLPTEWLGVVVSYTAYKQAMTQSGEQSKKGEPPFCSAVREHTSLRYNDQEKRYVQGPSCTGDEDAGIPACPLYNEGSSKQSPCKKGILVYVVLKDGSMGRIHLKYQFDVDNLTRLASVIEKFEPIKFSTKENKTYMNPVFTALKGEELEKAKAEFSGIKLGDYVKKAEEEILSTVQLQRGLEV